MLHATDVQLITVVQIAVQWEKSAKFLDPYMAGQGGLGWVGSGLFGSAQFILNSYTRRHPLR